MPPAADAGGEQAGHRLPAAARRPPGPAGAERRARRRAGAWSARPGPGTDNRGDAVRLTGAGGAAAVEDAEDDQRGQQRRKGPSGAEEAASRIRTSATIMTDPRVCSWPTVARGRHRGPAARRAAERVVGLGGGHRGPPGRRRLRRSSGAPAVTVLSATVHVVAPGSRAVSPRWSLTSTAPPAAVTSPTMSGTSSRAAASRPSQGSSSTSSRGDRSSAWARPTFCAVPLDSSPSGCRRRA